MQPDFAAKYFSTRCLQQNFFAGLRSDIPSTHLQAPDPTTSGMYIQVTQLSDQNVFADKNYYEHRTPAWKHLSNLSKPEIMHQSGR